jgi:hypothetical protein
LKINFNSGGKNPSYLFREENNSYINDNAAVSGKEVEVHQKLAIIE